MAGFLGTIAGRIRIDVKQAVASYAAVRAANASTLYALRGSSAAFIAAGKGMAVGGALMVGVFAAAVSKAAEFERKMDFFGAVTDATAEDLQKVSDKALQLGQDTIYSADQIAEAFVELGKAGVSTQLIMEGVGDAVANLGASADIPLAQAADIITAAVQTFNLEGSKAVHVADLLQGAANASIVEVEDLGVSLKYVGGVAASISIPIEEVIDAISILGKAGIKGSTAGTSLRQILVSLTGTSKKAKAQLEDLGIITEDGSNKFFDAAGKAKPLSEIFQILQDKTKGLTEAQRLAAFKIIFNNRALAAANILARGGKDAFAAMNEEIGKTTAAEVSSKRLDNLSGDIEILRGNIETLFIKGGGPFQEFLRKIVQGLTGLLQFFTNLPSGVQTAIFAFLGIGGALLLIMGTISLIVGTVLNFIAVMKTLGFAMQFLRGIMAAFTVVQWLLNAAMAANPIVLIIIAIIALVALFVLLYNKSEAFRNIIGAIGRFFVAVWGKVLDFFSGVPGFFTDLWETIKNAFGAAIDWIKEHWALILVIFSGPIGWIIALVVKFKDQIIGFFSALWSKVVEIVGNLITSVVGFFQELPGKIFYWLGFLLGRVILIWYTIWKTIIEFALKIVTGVVQFISELPGKLWNIFTLLFTTAINLWKTWMTWLFTTAQSIVNGIISFFQALPGRAAALFTAVKDRVVAIVTALWIRARTLASQIVQGIISFIQQLPGRVASFITSMKDRGLAIIRTMLSKAKELAGKIKDGFIGAITGLPGLVSEVFQKVLGAIGSFVGDLWEKAKSAGSSLWEGFKSGLGINSPSYLEKAMFQINETFGIEVPKMRKQVQKIQTFTNDVVSNNPAARASDAAMSAISALARANSAYQTVAQTMTGTRLGLSTTAAPSATALAASPSGKAGMTKIYDVTVNNPKPEPASRSLTNTLLTIGALGIGDGPNE